MYWQLCFNDVFIKIKNNFEILKFAYPFTFKKMHLGLFFLKKKGNKSHLKHGLTNESFILNILKISDFKRSNLIGF